MAEDSMEMGRGSQTLEGAGTGKICLTRREQLSV
jgi:hypothetical protein